MNSLCIGLSRKCNTVQTQRLKRRRKMLFKNMKLYIENKNIIEENKKLRMKAAILIKENQLLSSQLKHQLII
ncbi:hypothetical protein V2J09_011205 [Rumex salicifolius]